MKQRIEDNIKDNINTTSLNVINNSHLHSGHAGDDGSGETHFKIEISSKDFDGLSRIKQHQKVNKILKDEFEKGLHALEIKIS